MKYFRAQCKAEVALGIFRVSFPGVCDCCLCLDGGGKKGNAWHENKPNIYRKKCGRFSFYHNSCWARIQNGIHTIYRRTTPIWMHVYVRIRTQDSRNGARLAFTLGIMSKTELIHGCYYGYSLCTLVTQVQAETASECVRCVSRRCHGNHEAMIGKKNRILLLLRYIFTNNWSNQNSYYERAPVNYRPSSPNYVRLLICRAVSLCFFCKHNFFPAIKQLHIAFSKLPLAIKKRLRLFCILKRPCDRVVTESCNYQKSESIIIL